MIFLLKNQFLWLDSYIIFIRRKGIFRGFDRSRTSDSGPSGRILLAVHISRLPKISYQTHFCQSPDFPGQLRMRHLERFETF